jgi:hypothetical protein
MNRIIYLFVMLTLMTTTLMTPFDSYAQSNPGTDASFVSGDQKLVRMAIDSSLCVLRQDYTLTNQKGMQYGRNGKEYFGRTYTIGVMADNKVYTNAQLLKPWEGDPNYDKFKATDSIKPRLGATYARPLVKSAYVTVIPDTASPQGSDSAIATLSSPDTASNIGRVRNSQDRGGWLVLVASREAFSTNDTLPLNYTIYKAQPQFTETNNKGYIKNMPVKENLIGGIYFISRISLGRITFIAAGILGKDKTGWYVQAFPTTNYLTHTK